MNKEGMESGREVRREDRGMSGEKEAIGFGERGGREGEKRERGVPQVLVGCHSAPVSHQDQ